MVELDSNGKTLVSLKNLAAERYWDMRWQREWQTKYHDPQGVSCDTTTVYYGERGDPRYDRVLFSFSRAPFFGWSDAAEAVCMYSAGFVFAWTSPFTSLNYGSINRSL